MPEIVDCDITSYRPNTNINLDILKFVSTKVQEVSYNIKLKKMPLTSLRITFYV